MKQKKSANPAISFRMRSLLKNASGVTAIGRHSIKGVTSSGLTPEGEAKAVWSGSHLPRGFRVVASIGDQKRHETTARKMVEVYPGMIERQPRSSPALGFGWVKNMAKLDEIIAERGDPQAMADYIDGKIPKSVVEKPEIIGRGILQSAIGETQRLTQGYRPFHLNVTSSWYEAAVLKALGIDYRSIKPRKPRAKVPPKQGETLKETEAMLFFHLPDGRTILAFRGRRFDVTKQLEKILQK